MFGCGCIVRAIAWTPTLARAHTHADARIRRVHAHLIAGHEGVKMVESAKLRLEAQKQLWAVCSCSLICNSSRGHCVFV